MYVCSYVRMDMAQDHVHRQVLALVPVNLEILLLEHWLTFSRLTIYIYMSYCTTNLWMLHFIYLFNKYMY